MDTDGATPGLDLTKLNLWDDNPASTDLLGIGTVVSSIEQALSIEELDPLTIGIHSPWGGGKTTTLGLLESKLGQVDEYIIIRTNPWEYDNHDDVRALLIAEIVDALKDEFSADAPIQTKAKDLIKRISWSRVSAMVAKGAITMQWNPAEIVEAFTPKARKSPESMSGFRDEFAEFLDMLPDTKRVIILVDDLDRCLPDAVMATLEAIKLFLSVKKMAFVLAADQVMVRDAIAASLHATGRSEVFASRYLEKIIQIPVLLPRLNTDSAATYIALLLSALAAPDTNAYTELLQHCTARRTAGQNPILGNLSGLSWRPTDELLRLAERIAAGLSAEKASNPRYIKRFLNLFGLRMQVARANGVSVQPEVVAKLILLEDRFTKEFEHLLSLHAQARTDLLESWEDWAGGGSQSRPDNVSDDTKDWAAALPSLVGVELDTYLALAASFTSISISANLDDEQVGIVNNLASATQTLRQAAVQNFLAKSTSEKNDMITAAFGTIRRVDSANVLIGSMIEIAKGDTTLASGIAAGMHEYCWQDIDPANALEIMLSDVPEIVALGTELQADGDISEDVKQAIRQSQE